MFLDCYGPSENSCGCAQTAISLLDPSGIESCEIRGSSSKVFEDRCVIAPVITVTRISTMSYMNSASSEGRYDKKTKVIIIMCCNILLILSIV